MTRLGAAVLPGDHVDSFGRQDEIIEFVCGRYEDEVRVRSSGLGGGFHLDSLTAIHSRRVIRDGLAPEERLTAQGSIKQYGLSPALKERFEEAIFQSTRDWSRVTRPLVDLAATWGYGLWVVGGAVRDLLLGANPKDIKDLDLAGTVPPRLMRSFVDSVVRSSPDTAFLGWKSNTSGLGVVHLGHPSNQRPIDSFLQYASLRQRYDRSDANKRKHHWCFGADLQADMGFRDVMFNTLFYDPVTQTISAADKRALNDLGFDAHSLGTWTEEAATNARNHLVVRPIELTGADAVPDSWAAKGFARVVKSIDRNPNADLTPVRDWWAASGELVLSELRAPRGISNLQSYLRSFGLKLNHGELTEVCGGVLPPIALDALAAGLGTFQNVHLDGLGTGPLTGFGLLLLEGNDEPFTVGLPPLELDDIHPGNVNALYEPLIGNDAQTVILRIVTDDGRIARVRGINSRIGKFVELDDGGGPAIVEWLS